MRSSSPTGRAARSVFTLSTADRPYRMFVENMRDGAATVSSSGLILLCQPATGGAAVVLARRSWDAAGAFVPARPPIVGRLCGQGCSAPRSSSNSRQRRRSVPVLVGTSPLEVDGDQLTCLTFTDLSAQKAQDREIARLSQAQAERMAELQDAQAALTQQATHDALTGLPNRAC